jgi:hypothetical protein
MGIRGLTAFLKQGSLSSISDHVDLSAVTNSPADQNNATDSAAPSHHIVVIDGNAFSHWFCLECLGTAPSLNTDYKLLKRRVISWIKKCYDTKVECLFVFDGSTEPNKLQCRLDRLCKQSSNINTTLSQQLFSDRSNVTHHDQDLFYNTNSIKLQSTPPLLAISCIIGAIRDSKGTRSRAFFADGEADKIIVEVAVTLRLELGLELGLGFNFRV